MLADVLKMVRTDVRDDRSRGADQMIFACEDHFGPDRHALNDRRTSLQSRSLGEEPRLLAHRRRSTAPPRRFAAVGANEPRLGAGGLGYHANSSGAQARGDQARA